MTSLMQKHLQTAEKKSKFNGTDERSGRLIDCAKLGHVPAGETKVLQGACKEDWLTQRLSKGTEA